MDHIGYLLLSLIGLGILIFFHELGHYIVARRVGMTVEVFAIGFGRPILQWMVRGVRWQLGWIPFGGYVKIKGSDPKPGERLDEIPDGFFGKNQRFNRIKVALAGPLVNFLLAYLFFVLIWLGGGRARPFADSTQIVGYVTPNSALYQAGLRPGDRIFEVDGRPYRGFLSLIEAQAMASGAVTIKGTRGEEPFVYEVDLGDSKDLVQTVFPASYLIIQTPPKNNPVSFSGSPMHSADIKGGDRLLWLDGTYLYSPSQLAEALQLQEALLSVDRGGKYFLQRAPRPFVRDLNLTHKQRDQLMDLRYELGLAMPLAEMRTLPYEISPQGVVVAPLFHLEEPLTHSLLPGDRIVAIDGKPVDSMAQIFDAAQRHSFFLAVQRSKEVDAVTSAKSEDSRFEKLLDPDQMEKLAGALARGELLPAVGDLHLVGPISPIPLSHFAKTPGEKEELARYIEREQEQAEKLVSPERRALVMRMLEEQLSAPRLGLIFKDKLSRYNPSPNRAFLDVFSDTWRTLKALVTGPLSPKLLSGPIGIVKVMQGGFSTGLFEGLYWMALISVNLAILNLLPIPVLDGGHICFAIYEIVTGKSISPQTMQRLTIPFALLLMGFLIWITLQDIGRLLS